MSSPKRRQFCLDLNVLRVTESGPVKPLCDSVCKRGLIASRWDNAPLYDSCDWKEIMDRNFMQIVLLWTINMEADGRTKLSCSPFSCFPWSKSHDDVIKWKHFPRCWPFVRGIHQSQVNSPHKGQWRGTLMFSLICALNKRLSKQMWGWWFETPSRYLRRHCNGIGIVSWPTLVHRPLQATFHMT